MPLEKADDGIDQVGEEDGEREKDHDSSREIQYGENGGEERIVVRTWSCAGRAVGCSRLNEVAVIYSYGFQGDFHRGESALQRRAGFIDGDLRTMPPLNRVRPACCEPLSVIRNIEGC